jgi:hypothetical protein
MDLITARWVVETYANSIAEEYYKDNGSFQEWLSEAKAVVHAADHLTNY